MKGTVKVLGQDIELDIENRAAKAMQEEIDRKVLFDLLVECGWTRIELPSKWLPVSGIELHNWRVKNLKGEWKGHENTWLFEKSEDAVVFALKWS